MRFQFLLIAITLFLSACGSEAPKVESESRTQLEKQLSTQLDALDKAKQLEGQMQEAVEANRKEMEEQGI